MIFSYYPESNWLAKSPFINCKSKNAGGADRRVAAAP
jgi:hypothetical protein